MVMTDKDIKDIVNKYKAMVSSITYTVHNGDVLELLTLLEEDLLSFGNSERQDSTEG